MSQAGGRGISRVGAGIGIAALVMRARCARSIAGSAGEVAGSITASLPRLLMLLPAMNGIAANIR